MPGNNLVEYTVFRNIASLGAVVIDGRPANNHTHNDIHAHTYTYTCMKTDCKDAPLHCTGYT